MYWLARLIRVFILLGLAGILFAIFVWHRVAGPCTREMRIGSQQYWSLAKTGSLLRTYEEGGFIKGRIAATPGLCVGLPKTETDDPRGRTEGYREAVLFFTQKWSSPASFPMGGSPQEELKKLTGQEFASARDAQLWVGQNASYLVWSPEQDRLVIDEYAKRVKPASAAPQEDRDISAEEYWYLQAQRLVRTAGADGDYRLIEVQNDHQQWVRERVLESKLADLEMKRKGYIRATQSLLRTLFRTAKGDPGNEDVMFLLGQLTGENFREEDQWSQWNRDHNIYSLVLSSDGDHLVAKN